MYNVQFIVMKNVHYKLEFINYTLTTHRMAIIHCTL